MSQARGSSLGKSQEISVSVDVFGEKFWGWGGGGDMGGERRGEKER